MTEIGIGVIGGGYMGKAHSVAMAAVGAVFETRLRPRLEMIAASSLESAERYRAAFGFARAAPDWRALVDDPRVEAVIIASPQETHREIAEAAFARGKAVLCEKPLADTLAHTRAMVAAAEAAAGLAAAGDVAAIIKGGLPMDELLSALIRPDNGLATERTPSQVMAFDVPTYPRPLLISDPQVNIHPALFEKRDMVRNAVALAHALGIDEPRVAMLSSSEAIEPNLSSTLDAAAICKMADRGQVSGAVVDGPMAFDTAISEATARARGVDSPVAGRADILVAPDLEAASMLVKQLSHLADARGAGLLLGLRVPVVMSNRDDDVASRLTGIGLARQYLAHVVDARRGALDAVV